MGVSQAHRVGIKSVQSGYTSGSSLSSGAGEDVKYRDIVISPVVAGKCVVTFEGGASTADSNAMWGAVSGSTGYAAYKVTARMLSDSVVRLACVSAQAYLAGRWTVTEYF